MWVRCPRCAAELRGLSRTAAGNAGRAAALRGADELAPFASKGAAVGAATGVEPPLGAEGLCHGHGAVGSAGGEPGHRRHSNRSGPAGSRGRRFRHMCARCRPSHLTDVQTSDQHTVKPWFNGRLDVAPPGGRPDGPGLHADRRAARLYRRQGRRRDRLPTSDARDQSLRRAGNGLRAGRGGTRDGAGVQRRALEYGGLAFFAVSDISPDELRDFIETFEAAHVP